MCARTQSVDDEWRVLEVHLAVYENDSEVSMSLQRGAHREAAEASADDDNDAHI
jgi:hypothetical protein